jgi:hypothetical protein
MSTSIQHLFEEIKIGSKQTYKNMSVISLLSPTDCHTAFLLGSEAINLNIIRVSEISESGHVPELKVINKSDNKVLFLDGEELVGAKQNRVLNTTILVQERAQMSIPVSCVEEGRWSYTQQRQRPASHQTSDRDDKDFASENRYMSPRVRALKNKSVHESVLRGAGFRSSQSDIWNGIREKFARLNLTDSPTMAMSDIYEAKSEVIDDFHKKFSLTQNQIGMIVFINDQIAGLEILNSFVKFAIMYEQLIVSYGMDALETIHSGAIPPRGITARARDFMETIAKSETQLNRSVGLGEDIRIISDSLIGAGLEFQTQLVHLNVFPNTEFRDEISFKDTFSRASSRKSRMKNHFEK